MARESYSSQTCAVREFLDQSRIARHVADKKSPYADLLDSNLHGAAFNPSENQRIILKLKQESSLQNWNIRNSAATNIQKVYKRSVEREKVLSALKGQY